MCSHPLDCMAKGPSQQNQMAGDSDDSEPVSDNTFFFPIKVDYFEHLGTITES